MKLRMLGRIASTIALVLSCGCKQEVPDNHPCLIDLSKCADLTSCQCFSYKLVDNQKIVYQFDRMAQLSEVDGGFAFPKGELESLLQYARDEKAACESNALRGR